MTTRSKIVGALALGLLVAGGAAADASAATVAKTHVAKANVAKTRTVVATRAMRPIAGKKSVTIVHRFHRPLRHLAGIRVLPGHRLAPRIHLAKAFATKKVVKTTVVR